jgi:hypothetical protein
MATGLAFEIAEVTTLGAVVVLRDGDVEYRADIDSQTCADGLGGFLRAVTDLVGHRLWGAIRYWAGDQDDGRLVDVRHGTAWCEVTVFREKGDWPAATEAPAMTHAPCRPGKG